MNKSLFDRIRDYGPVPNRKKVTKGNRKGRLWRVQTVITYVNDRVKVKQIIHCMAKYYGRGN